jgi:hypothetical protein
MGGVSEASYDEESINYQEIIRKIILDKVKSTSYEKVLERTTLDKAICLEYSDIF